MNELGLTPFLCLSAFLFASGLLCIVTKRNAVGILMGVELVLNAANINFVACARYVPGFALEGQVFALLVIVLAAGEAAVALAIILNFYNNHATVDVDKADELQG
jgi:NADH:ubiquinone oxidoreductase subunit K